MVIRVGDNLKINSKITYAFLALLAIAMVISAASAVNLVNGFKNDDFGVKVLPGTDFIETVNITTDDIGLVIFENKGNNSSDANSIIYFKDSAADKSGINAFIKNLEKDGTKVEENGKYVVLKNNGNSHNFDVERDLDEILNFANSIFSAGDGLNISLEGTSVSFSDNGFEVSDVSGENVSITSDGISVSGDAFGNETINVSSDVNLNIENSNYSVYLKNKNKDGVIVISGNNLELLKAMAETASFNEN